MPAVEIVAAESGRAHRQFVDLPYRLYRGDPRFVAPLRRERRELFSRTRHPFFAHADAAFFVARRAGRVVGRIEAIVNHAYGAQHDGRTGFFGAYECAPDRAASDALLDAAAAWLRARGKTVMRGPYTHSQNEEYALLVDGFDAPPAVQLAYNPPYYAELLEGYGLRRARDLHAWWADADREPDARLLRIARGLKKINQLRLLALGVRPVYRRRGIELLLCLELREAARRLGYRGGELSMVWEDNEAIHWIIAAMGGRRTKTYRIYEGSLSPRPAQRGEG